MKEEFTRNVRNVRLIGIELVDFSEGFAVTGLSLSKNHLNGLNYVQGGVF